MAEDKYDARWFSRREPSCYSRLSEQHPYSSGLVPVHMSWYPVISIDMECMPWEDLVESNAQFAL
jgi:hypothetical protein